MTNEGKEEYPKEEAVDIEELRKELLNKEYTPNSLEDSNYENASEEYDNSNDTDFSSSSLPLSSKNNNNKNTNTNIKNNKQNKDTEENGSVYLSCHHFLIMIVNK
jgi:hypothetical protein